MNTWTKDEGANNVWDEKNFTRYVKIGYWADGYVEEQKEQWTEVVNNQNTWVVQNG